MPRVFENNSVRRQTGLNQAATILSMVASPNEAEAQNAVRAFRRSLDRHGLTIHDVADRIRFDPSPQREPETAPAWLAMSTIGRRLWLDAIRMRVKLSTWESGFVRDVRDRALSSSSRLSEAQLRSLQGLLDRAYALGVRP